MSTTTKAQVITPRRPCVWFILRTKACCVCRDRLKQPVKSPNHLLPPSVWHCARPAQPGRITGGDFIRSSQIECEAEGRIEDNWHTASKLSPMLDGAQDCSFKSHTLLPKCLQMFDSTYFAVRNKMQDLMIPHYLLMMDNLWHHGHTGEPLRSATH